MQLSKQQVNTILNNAPSGLDKKKILDGLILKGYELEGIDSNLVKQNLIPPQKAEEPGFLGGLKNDLNTRADRVGNILNRQDSSTLEKGVQVFGQGAGLAANAIEKTAEQIPGVKQAFGAIGAGIKWLSETAPVKAIGGIAGDTKWLQDATKLYDTDPNFRDTVDGVANIARLTGDVQMTADAVNLVKNATTKLTSQIKPTVAGVKTALENTKKVTEGIKNATGEIVPTADRIVNEEVTKALQLNATDVRNIESSTGNIVGRFMADKNLIGNNLVETQTNLKSFFKTNYDTVRSEISKVKTSYKPSEVPRYKQALTELKSQIEGVAGQENKLKEINTLLNKKKISLNDTQRVKELVDDTYSLYKNTGDVKEGVAKQGFAQIRSELKSFIEKEVKNNTGADISELNNNVSTSKNILDASEKRSTSGLTKSNFKMGDLAIFGAGSFIGSPLFGAALLIGKKIIESPAIRFRVAKWLDTLSDARKLKIQEELVSGNVPTELEKLVQSSESKIENIKAKTRAKTTISPKSTTKSLKVKGEAPKWKITQDKGAIPGETPLAVLGNSKNPIARIIEATDGEQGVLVIRKDGTYLLNPKTKNGLFDNIQAAQKEWAKSGIK